MLNQSHLEVKIITSKVFKLMETNYEKSWSSRTVFGCLQNRCFIEVNDDVEMIFKAFKHSEKAYNRKKYRYKAYYSLDRNDGIEHDALLMQLTPELILDKKQLK